MVYEGEVVGLILALELLKNTHRARALALNNQAAIYVSANFKTNSRQYLWKIFHTSLENTMQHHSIDHIKIRWTPGHTGILDNELADKEAKKAAAGELFQLQYLPKQLRPKKLEKGILLHSKSATKQELYMNIQELLKDIFKQSKRSGHALKIDPTRSSLAFLKLTNEHQK